MPGQNLNVNEIITQQQKRFFLQYNGPQPGNVARYAGQDGQYMIMTGVANPEEGDIDPVWNPDPRQLKRFKMVARSVSAPAIPTSTLVLQEKHGSVPRQLQRINCPLSVYEVAGVCSDPSDFLSGWSDYVQIYGEGTVTNKDEGDRGSWEGDDPILDSLEVSWSRIYPIGPISFGDNAQSIVTLEVIDVVYGSKENCSACGPLDDGTNWVYAITKSSGSTPGTAPRLIYTVTGGVAWTQAAIDGLGDIEDPAGIDIVGNYLVVYTRTAGGPTTSGYYYSEINGKTGAPGTWTKVTTGFVATLQVYDMFVLSPREIFFVADGGTIYKSTDITAGVAVQLAAGTVTNTALRRIHGSDETLVAVGGSGTVLVSNNRGVSWFIPTAVPVVATLQAVAVVSANLWWVGTAGGEIYYTKNAAESWTKLNFSGTGAGQVFDIVFVTPEVGWFANTSSAAAGRIFATWDGGQDWTRSAPRVQNLPTSTRFNRLAAPTADPSIAANNLAVAGLAGNGSDGILLIGQTNRV